MRMLKHGCVSVFVMWAACSAASASDIYDFTITQDTYIDSRQYGSYHSQGTNFANANVDKVFVNKAASGEDVAGSPTRGLFYLPASVFSYSPSQIASATVNFYVWSDKSGNFSVSLYPMTRSWVVGTGATSADGVTWSTYDAAHLWTSPGGDFDATRSVVATKGPVFDPDYGDRYFIWDITSLLKDPIARAELQNNGAMLKVTSETPPPGGYNGDAFSSYEDPVPLNWPYVEVTVAAPEPASLLMLAAGVPLVGWFRTRAARS